MIHSYQPFLRIVSPLLCHDDDSNLCLPTPYLINLHPGMPSLDLGAASSLYELHFDIEPEDEVKTGLSIEIQLCRSFFVDAAKEVDQDDGFLAIDGSWIEPFRPASSRPSPSSASSQSDPTTEIKSKSETKSKTFLVTVEWTSQDAATKVFDGGKIDNPSTDGSASTLGDYFARNILQKSSRWSKHDVLFENVSATNVDWLNRETKWSTYVMAKEMEYRNGAGQVVG